MYRNFFALLLAFATVAAYAQTDSTKTKKRELSVYASVADHLTHNGIDSLKASLLRADSSYVDSAHVESYKDDDKLHTYVEASIKEAGKYLLLVEAKGYQPRYAAIDIPRMYRREVYRELKPIYLHKIKAQKPSSYGMENDSTVMDEIVVKATKLKFYMDGDTLVYDADAFSMAEGSMLDALIKKLPGVELHSGGEITVNGRKVDALLLNGKDFFDSDRELLLDNMPSYMVKDIRSYERTPENAKGTIREKTTQKEMVMDVRLKRDYNKAWLANAEGGVGKRFGSQKDFGEPTKAPPFLGRAFAMRYATNSRIALYANVNNLSDYRTPGEKGEWSPLRQAEGLTTSYTLGANGLYEKGENLRYQGSLNGTYSDINDANHGSGETFLSEGNTFERSFFTRRSYDLKLNTTHNIRLQKQGVLWGALKTMYFDHRSSLEYLHWSNFSNSASTTLAEDVSAGWGKAWMDSLMTPNAGELLRRYALNRTLSRRHGVGRHYSLQNWGFLYTSPAHNDFVGFELSYNYNYSDRYEDAFEHYLLDYPKTAVESDFRNRYRPNNDRTHNASIEPSLSFVLGGNHHHTISLENDFTYNNNESNRSLYLLNQIEEWKDTEQHPLGTLPSTLDMLRTLDANNSQISHNKTVTNTPEISYNFSNYNDSTQTSNYFHAGIAMPIRHETLDYWQGSQVDTTMTRRVKNIAVNIGFYHSRRKTDRNINAEYSTRVSQPSMRSLLNIRTDSDPLNIQLGNPDLQPSRSHSIYGSYREKLRRVLVHGSFRFEAVQDAVATATLYDLTTGVRTRTPQNIDGNWSTHTSAGVDFPLDHKERLRLKQSLSYNYNHSVDLMNLTRSVVASNNLDDELSLAWKPTDKLDFMAKSNLHYQRSTSTKADFMAINVFDFDYGLSGQIELPWNLQLATDLTMYSRRGYIDNTMNTNELVWNARLTKRLMHGNLLLQLDGFDLLGQLSNVRRYIDAQGRSETFYNVIPSYGLFHVTWRLNKKPKSEEQ
ncbi:MAG: outer membrane beta-barrel protein [Bacteroidaceae bacterium]|nr:outer membrane beta-barrel protein [Bacteroidaceae bacterium]